MRAGRCLIGVKISLLFPASATHSMAWHDHLASPWEAMCGAETWHCVEACLYTAQGGIVDGPWALGAGLGKQDMTFADVGGFINR
jgi:hypothetical protein